MGVQNLKKNVKSKALLQRVISIKDKENGGLLLQEKIQGYTSYNLIINNIKYPITKEIFIEEEKIGDSFEIEVRPHGKALKGDSTIRIEKRKDSDSNNNDHSIVDVTIDNIYVTGDINDSKT